MTKYENPNIIIHEFDKEAVTTASGGAQAAVDKWAEANEGATVQTLPYKDLELYIY